MTVVAGIAVRTEDFVVGRVLSPSSTRIELTQFVPVDDHLVPYFWKERDDEQVAFERAVRSDSHVRSLTTLDGRADRRLYRIEWAAAANGLLGALADHDIMVEEGHTAGSDRWTFRLRAPSQEELSAFQATCFDGDVPLDLRHVRQNPDAGARTPVQSLSAEQREALVAAYRAGYFDIPQGHSQAEIATELGISRQAFSRRLKRAERNLLDDLLWSEFDDWPPES
jgi:hypothetical protein